MAISRKAKIIVGASVLVLLLIIIVASIFATRKDTPEVTVVKVEKRKELRSNVTASGEIRPIQFINLTSEVQGRIEEIYVKEGDAVTKGTALVKLNPTQLDSSTDAQQASLQASQTDAQVSRSQVISAQNQYSQSQQGLIASEASVDTAIQQVASAKQQVASARQQVETAKTDVDARQVDLEAAQRELKRSTELLEANVIPRQEYDQKKDAYKQAQNALNNAKSRLESAKRSVNEAEGRVKEAEARVKESRARASQQQVAVRDAKRSVDTANLSAESSQSRSNQQAALLRGQRTQRDKTLQSAPIDGVIADIPSKVGTFAVANLSSTPLLTIADMSSINVEVKVDETEIDKVAEGQSVKVKVDAFGEKELVGKVKLKNPLALGKSVTTGGLSTNINTQEAKEFKVVVELIDIPKEVRDGLRPGMSATVVITTKTANDLIAVPLQSVIEKKPEASPSPTIQGDLQMPAEKPKTIKGVYILDGNKAKFVEVQTGITGESDIQITSGLNEGDQVITGPSRILNTLKEGTVVKKQEKKDGENANKS